MEPLVAQAQPPAIVSTDSPNTGRNVSNRVKHDSKYMMTGDPLDSNCIVATGRYMKAEFRRMVDTANKAAMGATEARFAPTSGCMYGDGKRWKHSKTTNRTDELAAQWNKVNAIGKSNPDFDRTSLLNRTIAMEHDVHVRRANTRT